MYVVSHRIYGSLCLGGSVLIDTWPWLTIASCGGTFIYPGMGRVSMGGDNPGMTCQVEGAAASRAGDRKARTHRGAGTVLGGGSTGHVRGWGVGAGKASCPR